MLSSSLRYKLYLAGAQLMFSVYISRYLLAIFLSAIFQARYQTENANSSRTMTEKNISF